MNVIITFGVIVFLFIVTPLLFWLWIWNKSFIHTVRVAVQTGEDPTDVVWKTDKFKVIDRDGYNQIAFKYMKGGARAPSGDKWTKFITRDNLTVDITKFWKTKNLPNLIQRGLFLYRSLDGQFSPMVITKGGDFKVLPEDNRAFIVQTQRDVSRLVMTGKQQLIAVVIVVVAMLVLGISFVMMLVYLGQVFTSNAAMCAVGQAVAENGLVAGAQAVIGG
jgi:hypothetical protein